MAPHDPSSSGGALATIGAQNTRCTCRRSSALYTHAFVHGLPRAINGLPAPRGCGRAGWEAYQCRPGRQQGQALPSHPVDPEHRSRPGRPGDLKTKAHQHWRESATSHHRMVRSCGPVQRACHFKGPGRIPGGPFLPSTPC